MTKTNKTMFLISSVVLMSVVSAGAALAAADGKALYESKCALCHGKDGVAKEMLAKKGARNFNDPAWQKEKTDEQITKDTAEGIAERKMPAYKDKLGSEEIAAIVKHLRTLAPTH